MIWAARFKIKKTPTDIYIYVCVCMYNYFIFHPFWYIFMLSIFFILKKKYLSIFFYFEVVKWIVLHHYKLSQLSYAYACFCRYLYCCIITGQSFPTGKKTPLKCYPEYNQQLFLCWSSWSQWGSVQLLSVFGRGSGPAVTGAIAVLRWQGWQPGCPHTCVTLIVLPKLP